MLVVIVVGVLRIRRTGSGAFASRNLLHSATDMQLSNAGMRGQGSDSLDDVNCERGRLTAVDCNHAIFGREVDGDSSQRRDMSGTVIEQAVDALVRKA